MYVVRCSVCLLLLGCGQTDAAISTTPPTETFGLTEDTAERGPGPRQGRLEVAHGNRSPISDFIHEEVDAR